MSVVAAKFVDQVPALQLMHASDPVTFLYVPGGHGTHSVPLGPEYPALQTQSSRRREPDKENALPGQAKHVPSSFAASVLEYVPGLHRSHAADPFASLYVPPIHAEHPPPLSPVYPALQMQSSTPSLPLSEYVLFGHNMHVSAVVAARSVEKVPPVHVVQPADPFTVLYVPAAHAVHASPSSPVYPGLHTQSVAALLPLSEDEFSGHNSHALSHVAAAVVEYVPAPHAKHPDDPFTALYLPASHAVHSPPSRPVYPALHLQSVAF